MKVAFKSRKLKTSITKVYEKVKNNPSLYKDYTVYGVTKEEGISITGNIASEDLSEYIVVEEKTFAFNPYRVNIGSIGLSEKDFKGLVSPAYVVFKTKKDLLPDFLFHFLKSDTGIKLINWYGNRGGVRNALRYDDLGEIDIPDLSIEEQIEALKKINDAKQGLQLINTETELQQTQIQLLRQTILQEAVQGKLTKQDKNDEPATELLKRIKAEKQKLIKEGFSSPSGEVSAGRRGKKEKELPPITEDEIPFELPKGWVWCRLGEICEFINGDRSKNYPNAHEYVPEGIAWINTGHIEPDGTLSNSSMHFITRKKFDSLRSGKIAKGDLVYCLRGATIGKTAFTHQFKEGAIASSLMIVRAFNEISRWYLYYYLTSPLGKTEIKKFDNGSAQPNLSANSVGFYLFPLPPLTEQQRIVAKVQQLQQQLNALETQVQQSRQYAQQLLQAVLKEAFEVNKKQYATNEQLTLAAEN